MPIAPTLNRRLLLLGSAGLIAAPGILRAQPVAGGRPARVIVPFPPGGAVDITSRLFAERLGAFELRLRIDEWIDLPTRETAP